MIQLRNLEVTASLFGLNPANIKKCRVLEIGCADGTNLLPFAVEFPDSTFVGVDLAAEQIRKAAELAQCLHLQNVEFHAANVTDSDLLNLTVPFDYILVPGVFSWITDSERQSLLQVLQKHLAPTGVAAVSFNVLPGWNFREPLREFIRRHVKQFADPVRQVQEARLAVRFLAKASTQDSVHRKLYSEVHRIFATASDHYIFHDYISDRNQPFYFSSFVDMLTDHQLQFVAECDFCHNVGLGLNSEAKQAADLSPILDREQLIDFVANTAYRRTMVSHQSAAVTRRLNHSSMTGLHLALAEKISELPSNLADTDPWQLDYQNGTLTTTEPLGKAAIQLLNGAWPLTRTVDQLYQDACRLLPEHLHVPAADSNLTSGSQVLAQSMLAAFAAGFVQVFKTPPNAARWPPLSASSMAPTTVPSAASLSQGEPAETKDETQTTSASSKPQTSRLLRLQAERGGRLVNLWHQNIGDLQPDELFVLSRLDGSRDLSVLAADLQQFFRANVSSPVSIDAAARLNQILNRLNAARLLQNTSPATPPEPSSDS